MTKKYTLTQGAVQWLVNKLKGSARKQDVLTYEEIQASTDLSGKIASASSVEALSRHTPTLSMNDTVINNVWCSFIEFQSCAIAINHYDNKLYWRKPNGTWYVISGSAL